MTDDSFDNTYTQKVLAPGDVPDAQDDAQDATTMNDPAPEQGSATEGSALDSASKECTTAEQEEEIVDQTVQPNPMKNQTRSKSLKVVIPVPCAPLMCSYSKDELPRQQLSSASSVTMPVQQHNTQMDMPSISDKTRINFQVLSARGLLPGTSWQQLAKVISSRQCARGRLDSADGFNLYF